MGPAHTREPHAEDVLNSLALDSAGIENNATFESWCREYGYSCNNAERIYKIKLGQAERLKAFLGPDLYQNLLVETESL
jgi:hypothetical protein